MYSINSQTVKIASQFHVRQVTESTPIFVELAENNEMLVSRNNMLLGIQAHPEIQGKFARAIMEDDDTTYTEGRTGDEVRGLRDGVEGEQDGLAILSRVMEWVAER
jgi:hypothetical protein